MSDFDWNRWAQALSEIPGAAPSLFFALEAGKNRRLDIIFSHTFLPPGKFNLRRDGKNAPNWRLYLNCAGNDYYQRGIPGVTTSLDATAAWLGRIAAGLDISFVRMIGVSMGASAALIFGHRLAADRLIAVGPEILLGVPHDRSFIWNEAKVYDPRYRDLAPIVKGLGARFHLVFPAYDLADFIHIARAQETAAGAIFVPSFHSGGQCLDWPKILAAETDLSLPQDLTAHPVFAFDYRPQVLAESAAAFMAICERRFDEACERLAALCAEKPNPGLKAQMAAQLLLKGDEDAPRAALAEAKAEHRAFYKESGIEAPDAFPSRLVMGAYRHVLSEAEQERVRGLFDRSAASHQVEAPRE